MTLAIQRPKHRGCLLENRGKEIVPIARQKINAFGVIFQRSAAAWLPAEQERGPGSLGGSLPPG